MSETRKTVANPARVKAVLDRRRSNAAGAHANGAARQRTRRDAQEKAIREQEDE